ncbi:FRG domain-containing protein [Rhizobium leguminosarum]|uniref:FRG domain-containing protein n=1 Tax=Rhizobium leguminosarum TaxID=384 RepID=UPI001031A34D|nr:FRG domain-containing protein [Rhizobium leguminosarum]
MEIIAKERLFSFTDTGRLASRTCLSIRKDRGCRVKNYLDLATRVAKLQYKNPNYVMLFRGQPDDYRRRSRSNPNSDFSTLKPNLFRGSPTPSATKLQRRFDRLAAAENHLVVEFERARFPDLERLQRHRILRWSILQHYEVCKTPLLDVTHSLRIAASFATHEAQGEAYVFVLGVPNISGAITASAEAGLQIIRLASVCPPAAVRPHIQEGYLLGEYPDMGAYHQKQFYLHHEIDFGRRVAAKFRFDPDEFWRNIEFPLIGKDALYPNRNDRMYHIAESIAARLTDED